MRTAVGLMAGFCLIFVGTLLIVDGVMTAPSPVAPSTRHISTIPYPITERR